MVAIPSAGAEPISLGEHPRPANDEQGVPGVSIVVCCHNSARRLPETLRHLAAQIVPEGLAWEVVVVDNASSDDTGEVARSLWPEETRAVMRVVSEPRAGLSYARERGIAEARHQIVSFIDDDNWVSPNWVRLVDEIMREHPEVGACGGAVDAAPEGAMPDWFRDFQWQYAVGSQAETAGDVTCTRGWLWGAGLSVRRSAVASLFTDGFQFLAGDRCGTSLSACGDIEICYALRLSRWRLWYDPRLRLKHFLPAQRLTWDHLRRMCRGSAASEVRLDAYRFVFNRPNGKVISRAVRSWQWQALVTMKKLLKHSVRLSVSGGSFEGHPSVLAVETQRTRLLELLRRRSQYNAAIRRLYEAPWIRDDRIREEPNAAQAHQREA